MHNLDMSANKSIRENFMADCKRRDIESTQKRMQAMTIAQENKKNAVNREKQSYNNVWEDKLKEDDLLKHNTNKYANWIR